MSAPKLPALITFEDDKKTGTVRATIGGFDCHYFDRKQAMFYLVPYLLEQALIVASGDPEFLRRTIHMQNPMAFQFIEQAFEWMKDKQRLDWLEKKRYLQGRFGIPDIDDLREAIGKARKETK